MRTTRSATTKDGRVALLAGDSRAAQDDRPHRRRGAAGDRGAGRRRVERGEHEQMTPTRPSTTSTDAPDTGASASGSSLPATRCGCRASTPAACRRRR